jgi:hypothetical protein
VVAVVGQENKRGRSIGCAFTVLYLLLLVSPPLSFSLSLDHVCVEQQCLETWEKARSNNLNVKVASDSIRIQECHIFVLSDHIWKNKGGSFCVVSVEHLPRGDCVVVGTLTQRARIHLDHTLPKQPRRAPHEKILSRILGKTTGVVQYESNQSVVAVSAVEVCSTMDFSHSMEAHKWTQRLIGAGGDTVATTTTPSRDKRCSRPTIAPTIVALFSLVRSVDPYNKVILVIVFGFACL